MASKEKFDGPTWYLMTSENLFDVLRSSIPVDRQGGEREILPCAVNLSLSSDNIRHTCSYRIKSFRDDYELQLQVSAIIRQNPTQTELVEIWRFSVIPHFSVRLFRSSLHFEPYLSGDNTESSILDLET